MVALLLVFGAAAVVLGGAIAGFRRLGMRRERRDLEQGRTAEVQAKARIVRADDAVRDAEREVAFVEAQFGAASARELRATVEGLAAGCARRSCCSSDSTTPSPIRRRNAATGRRASTTCAARRSPRSMKPIRRSLRGVERSGAPAPSSCAPRGGGSARTTSSRGDADARSARHALRRERARHGQVGGGPRRGRARRGGRGARRGRAPGRRQPTRRRSARCCGRPRGPGGT